MFYVKTPYFENLRCFFQYINNEYSVVYVDIGYLRISTTYGFP